MKKFLALIAAAAMLMTLFAGCGKQKPAPTEAPTEAPTQAPTEAPTDAATEATEVTEEQAPALSNGALEILSSIWNAHSEDQKFFVYGGDSANVNYEGPAVFDLNAQEELTYMLLVPEEQIASLDEAASMTHGMNANTFTCGVFHIAEGADLTAFAGTMKETILNNQWMCGFPDELLVASVNGDYVVVCFGKTEPITNFRTALTAAYADAEILYSEAII